jgi:hypothetical protein
MLKVRLSEASRKRTPSSLVQTNRAPTMIALSGSLRNGLLPRRRLGRRSWPRSAQPGVELVLYGPLDDQTGNKLRELRQRPARVPTQAHGQQRIDPRLYLRRWRYGAPHRAGSPALVCQDLRGPTPCPRTGSGDYCGWETRPLGKRRTRFCKGERQAPGPTGPGVRIAESKRESAISDMA